MYEKEFQSSKLKVGKNTILLPTGIMALMQVHDSLAGIFHKDDFTAIQRIKSYMELEIPYKDPLIIPADIKTSAISYGDCK
jgi:hypothetical protein